MGETGGLLGLAGRKLAKGGRVSSQYGTAQGEVLMDSYYLLQSPRVPMPVYFYTVCTYNADTHTKKETR